MKKKIRLIDIAKKANVSMGTIDRVLHNRGEVNDETRKKVMLIIDEMGYTPNIHAKSLATKKTKRIVVIIPNSNDNNPYWKKPLLGIKRAATKIANFNTFIDCETFDSTDEQSFKNIFEKVLKNPPDGIVFNPVFQSLSKEIVATLKEKNIPYIFLDINLKGVDNISYFGQNAMQSGIVAAKLMLSALTEGATILIVKPANKKSFTRHIVKREIGFKQFLSKNINNKSVKILSVDIDLLEKDEPFYSLDKIFKENKTIDSIFVPNSRGFKVAEYLIQAQKNNILLLAYDLVEENIKYLKSGQIDFLISQKPEEQAYKSVMALFNYIMSNKESNKINYSSIDIIIKENIDFYKNF